MRGHSSLWVEVPPQYFLVCHVATCLKGYMNLCVEASNGKSVPDHVWWPLV